jgi:hypothetical protein
LSCEGALQQAGPLGHLHGFRKHVPNGVLSSGLFPILTHPSTQAVTMLPFECWTIKLTVLWKENRS